MELVRGNYPLAFPFLSLPKKPLAEIIKFLKPDDLRNLRLVNHELLRLVDGKRDTIRLPRNEIEHEHDLIHIVANWHRWPKLKVFEAFTFRYDALQGLENAAWTDLEDLNLTNCSLGEAGGIGLARAAKYWRKLNALNIQSNKLTSNAIAALSEVPLPLLKTLNLGWSSVGPAIGAALANGATQWPSLRKLSLGNVMLDDAGLEALLSARFPLLEDIDLCENELQLTAGFVFANAATQWPNLRVLSLEHNNISSLGWQRLATVHFDKLEELVIGSMDEFQLDPASVRALKDCARHWPRLRSLALITDDELAINGLFKEGGWEALETLYLDGDTASFEEELMGAVHGQQLPSLKELNLTNCTCTSGTFIENLFKFPWATLEELHLDGCEDLENEDDGVADALARIAINLPALRILSLRDRDLTLRQTRHLMASFGCIEKLDLSSESQTFTFSGTSSAQEGETSTTMLTYS